MSFCLMFSLVHGDVVAAEEEEPAAKEAMMESNTAKKKAAESARMSKDEKKMASGSETDDSASMATKPARIINAPTDAFKQQQDDLKHYFNSDAVEAILVGTDEFVMLTNKHKSVINKGVMILIPDWQRSAASPNAIKQLRDNMPDKGWTTLTLHPPHQPGNYPSQALTAEERQEENDKSLTDYQQKLSKVISAVIDEAKNYPGAILVVAEGQHASLVVNMVQSELIEAPGALVMLSSYMPTSTENTKLTEQVAFADYPILDLYLKRDHRLVLASTKNRKDRARNEMKVYYRQKQLSNLTAGYYPKQGLTREIIGWLKSIGW